MASRIRRVPRASEFAVYSGVSNETLTWLWAEGLNFVRLDFLNNFDEVGRVCQVAVVKNKAPVTFVWVLVEVIDPLCVEQ